MKIRPIILCGGAGTRLWPKSKKNTPKQFIDWGGWTLLLDHDSIWTASWICALIGIIFGVFPAVKASKLDPMEALTIE